MPHQKKSNNLTERNEVEDARIGYQAAISLWAYEGNLLWSKFNALLIANSIVLGSIGLTISVSNRLAVFSIGMPIMGIFLCVLWFLLTKRSFDTYRYWILSAREIEENFLRNFVRTVSRGGDFAEGKKVSFQIGSKPVQLQLSSLGRLRVRYTSYFIISLFFALYVATLIVNIKN